MIPGISWLWVVPPLATGLVLLAHPIIDPWHAAGVAGLAPLVAHNDVWLAVHLALLVLFPLSALALLQPVSGMESAPARVARVMLGIFGVLYAGFDTFAGLATGTIVRAARDLGAVALTLRRAGAPRAPVGLIVVAALLLFLDHPAPFGPVTFAAVAAALAWLAWSGPAKD